MATEYQEAYRQGVKAFKKAQAEGRYPYLPALDHFLSNQEILTEQPLGLIDIPMDQIVGTKTEGRQEAFALNFMPIIDPGSEFAQKWQNVYRYQVSEGCNDPIKAYEFMNRYYVLEGNKRVSVFKYLGAYSIEGNVTRLVPRYSADPKVRIFYEYMEFYRRTGINYIYFDKQGSFTKLCELCGMTKEQIWSEDERSLFSSNFQYFRKAFEEKGGKKLDVSVSDAFLLYLTLYPYGELADKTAAKLNAELTLIWNEFPVIAEKPASSLVLEPQESEAPSIFTRFFSGTGSRQLKIAFIYDRPVGDSSWVYGHELGRMHLDETFKDRVSTHPYFVSGEQTCAQALEQAVADGANIIFTTDERMLDDSLKAALENPSVHILNCSVNRTHRAIRTYYGRMHEAKYLEGIIAGAMAENDKIAYVADYPIYGTVAGINAFAIGARMVNPRAQIYLCWNGLKEGAQEELERTIRENDIEIIADMDLIRPRDDRNHFGLYRLRDGKLTNLAAPLWNWGKFYEKIVRDIVSGSFANTEAKGGKAINYWWGISGEIIDLVTSRTNVPVNLTRLVGLIRNDLYRDMHRVFEGPVLKQDGSVAIEEGVVATTEQVITMDWLCKGVCGRIPRTEELSEIGQELVKVQGITLDEE